MRHHGAEGPATERVRSATLDDERGVDVSGGDLLDPGEHRMPGRAAGRLQPEDRAAGVEVPGEGPVTGRGTGRVGGQEQRPARAALAQRHDARHRAACRGPVPPDQLDQPAECRCCGELRDGDGRGGLFPYPVHQGDRHERLPAERVEVVGFGHGRYAESRAPQAFQHGPEPVPGTGRRVPLPAGRGRPGAEPPGAGPPGAVGFRVA